MATLNMTSGAAIIVDGEITFMDDTLTLSQLQLELNNIAGGEGRVILSDEYLNINSDWGDWNDPAYGDVFMLYSMYIGQLLGDPYIIPYKGTPNKLPDKRAFYNLFKNKDILINCFVDKKNIEKEMKSYINDAEMKYSVDNLITEGYWCSRYYIESESNVITFNITKGRISGNNSNEEYFKIIENNEIYETEKERQLGGGITKQIMVEWTHSEHGKQGVMLNIYRNPQVQNGISYKSQLYDKSESRGLMVESTTANKYELNTISGRSLEIPPKKKKLI